MYNKVILAGNLTRDIEINFSQGGTAFGKTAIATSRKFKSSTGEQKEEVLFIDLELIGRTAEIANQYLRKGSKVLVEGRLKLDQWTAQDGSKRSAHKVVVEQLKMLGSPNENGNSGNAAQSHGGGYGGAGTDQYNPSRSVNGGAGTDQYSAPASNIPEIDINEDEIPF